MSTVSQYNELRLLPIVETATKYGCSRRHIERLHAAGHIDLYKPFAKVLVDLDSFDRYLITTKIQPKSKAQSTRRGAPRKR